HNDSRRRTLVAETYQENRMRMIKLMSSAVLLSAMVIGCEKSETTPTAPPTPAKPATPAMPPAPATPQADSTATPAAPATPAVPAQPSNRGLTAALALQCQRQTGFRALART